MRSVFWSLSGRARLPVWAGALMLIGLVACGASDDSSSDGGVEPPSEDVGPSADAKPTLTDAAGPSGLASVSGDLTYYQWAGATGGHLYSVQTNGQLRQRLTTEPKIWSHHAVGGEDRSLIVGVQHAEVNGPGEVWVFNVRTQDSWAISPSGCDAGIGGVGWRDELRVVFAMRCGDEPSQAYMVNIENRARARDALLQVTDHDVPVRDVFTAVGTPIFTYVLDTEFCEGGPCVTKPQVWAGLTDGTGACQVTDGSPSLTDTSNITGPTRRVGDHSPAFNQDLTSIVFSRNVADKPAGPEGHHDLFRVGFSARALFGSRPCDQGGLTNLSDELFDDTYTATDGRILEGDERYPQAAAGTAPQNSILYTGQTHAGGAASRIWLVEFNGTRSPLTAETERAEYGRWIVLNYTLSGER